MTFETWFQTIHADIPVPSALAVIKLTEEGSTLPFIARYRKEQTGNLDEVAIQKSIDAKERWDEILLVEYPSAAAFAAMVTSPEYKAIVFHRTAALEDSRLVATTAK